MREIKFRVWDEINTMLYPDGNGYFDNGKNFVIDGLGELIYLDDNSTPNGILMQFTGLKDKNGVDIYEGDVIDLHQTINGVSKFTVEWSNKRMGWTLRYAENMVTPRAYEYSVSEVFSIEEIEVIGNIYENPELLK